MSDPRVRILSTKILAKAWATLSQHTFEYVRRDGKVQTLTRETYDRGDGVVILLYNRERRTVLLVRQFRLATYVNNPKDGFLIEAPAGALEGANPEARMIQEVKEETGYEINGVKKVFESYMSPGTVTEKLHFYVAEYSHDQKRDSGGGLPGEGEDIEVLELKIDEAARMMRAGEIQDAKTLILIQYALLHLFAEQNQSGEN